MKTTLTPKQKRFVHEYLATGNASEAYRRAYNAARMTEKTIHETASKLLADPKVAARLAEMSVKAVERTTITLEKVLREAARIAFSDPRSLFRGDGRLKRPDELDDDTAAAVASIEVFEEFKGRGNNRVLVGHTRRVKLWDKNGALDRLMRHLGMFEKDNRQKGDDALTAFFAQYWPTTPGFIQEIRERAALPSPPPAATGKDLS